MIPEIPSRVLEKDIYCVGSRGKRQSHSLTFDNLPWISQGFLPHGEEQQGWLCIGWYCSDFRGGCISLNKKPDLLALSQGSCGAEFHSWADLEQTGSWETCCIRGVRSKWGHLETMSCPSTVGEDYIIAQHGQSGGFRCSILPCWLAPRLSRFMPITLNITL